MACSHEMPAYVLAGDNTPPMLPFPADEYEGRLASLRERMASLDLEAVLLTSMQTVAYYTGFLYCAFGRPYACVVTVEDFVTLSAGIDAPQPCRRSYGRNVIYTDWQRGNFWRALESVMPAAGRCGYEGDDLSHAGFKAAERTFPTVSWMDMSDELMWQRVVKSEREIELIAAGARIADAGGDAARGAIAAGERELDVAMAARDAMERLIAEQFPDSKHGLIAYDSDGGVAAKLEGHRFGKDEITKLVDGLLK